MTHNMKAFLELSGQDRELAAHLQLLMLSENGWCSAATQAAVIRLAEEHGLILNTVDFDYMAPDNYTQHISCPDSGCHCFRNGSGITNDGHKVCNCVMYGVGRSASSKRYGSRRECVCPSAGVGSGI